MGSFTRSAQASRLRTAQAQLGKARRLQVARTIVEGQIRNQRALLYRTPARRALVPVEHGKALDAAARNTATASSADVLMGIEGAAGRRYFDAMARLVPAEWGMNGRNRRPPRDPVNALLSYGYALLLNEARTAIECASLDPYTGFLHAPWRDRPSLALDLMEEFRPLLVDTVVLWIISVGSVRREQFTDEGDAGCRIDLAGRRTLIAEFERRMLTTVNHPTAHRRMSYREAMGQQALDMAQIVAGHLPVYRPLPWR